MYSLGNTTYMGILNKVVVVVLQIEEEAMCQSVLYYCFCKLILLIAVTDSTHL